LNGTPKLLPRPDEPDAAELAAMLSAEEADVVLSQECPDTCDVSLSEMVWCRRRRGAAKVTRRCTAVLLFEGPDCRNKIEVSLTDWNDVLDEVRRQYEGSTRRNA
jgi:hypothetical protein